MQHLTICIRYMLEMLRHAGRHWVRELWVAFIAAVLYEYVHHLIESGVAEHAPIIAEKISHGG